MRILVVLLVALPLSSGCLGTTCVLGTPTTSLKWTDPGLYYRLPDNDTAKPGWRLELNAPGFAKSFPMFDYRSAPLTEVYGEQGYAISTIEFDVIDLDAYEPDSLWRVHTSGMLPDRSDSEMRDRFVRLVSSVLALDDAAVQEWADEFMKPAEASCSPVRQCDYGKFDVYVTGALRLDDLFQEVGLVRTHEPERFGPAELWKAGEFDVTVDLASKFMLSESRKKDSTVDTAGHARLDIDAQAWSKSKTVNEAKSMLAAFGIEGAEINHAAHWTGCDHS